MKSQKHEREQRQHVPVLDEPVAGVDQEVGHRRAASMSKSLKIFSNFGMMKIMMKVKMAHGDDDDHDRVDHGADLILPLEASGPSP